MSKPRLVYAANRRIGFKGLEILLEEGWEPVVLICPQGEKAEYVESMKQLVPHVPVLAGKKFREPHGIQKLKSLVPDYILMVHFPYLVPPEVLEIPRIGTLNLHPAYLPFNRGWHTPTWSIQEETTYGATLHWVDEGLDTGDIALRRSIEVRPDDTAHNLYQRVLKLEEQVIREAIPLLLTHRLPRAPQELGGTSHVKADIQTVQKLDLSEEKKVGDVIKFLRSLTTNTWTEAAYFEVDGVRYRIKVEIKKDGDE